MSAATHLHAASDDAETVMRGRETTSATLVAGSAEGDHPVWGQDSDKLEESRKETLRRMRLRAV